MKYVEYIVLLKGYSLTCSGFNCAHVTCNFHPKILKGIHSSYKTVVSLNIYRTLDASERCVTNFQSSAHDGKISNCVFSFHIYRFFSLVH
jgi:hypothetical protein